MRQPVDALRSFKKYVAASLGPEWEVRLSGEEGAFTRPFARVGSVGAARMDQRGLLIFDMRQAFSVVCHPVEKATPDEARLEAARVQMVMVNALAVGTHQPAFRVVGSRVLAGHAQNISRAHPMRVPLYDYDGVGLNETVDANARHPRDFMRIVEAPSVDVIPDQNDELLYAVATAATMSWAVSAAVLSDAMTVQSVTAEWEGN